MRCEEVAPAPWGSVSDPELGSGPRKDVAWAPRGWAVRQHVCVHTGETELKPPPTRAQAAASR